MQIIKEAKRKSEVFELLSKISKPEVRREMLEIIQEARKCPLKEARNIKTLRPNEVNEVLKRFDYVTV